MAESYRRLRSSVPAVSPASLGQSRALAFAWQWQGLLWAAAFGLVAALIYIRTPDVFRPLFDDSYISLTYARNLAEHGMLSFDGETWSTGATSPLHVSILAVLLKLGASAYFASAAVGVAGHMLVSAGVYLLAWSIFRSRLAAVLGALAIAFTSYAALDAGNGLETSLFMALVAFTGASYFLTETRRGRLLTGGLIALAILTRPEGALLLPAVLIYRWLERQDGESLTAYAQDALRLALPGLLAGMVLLSYALAVSGTLSATGGAKMSFFQEDAWDLSDKLGVAADQIGIFAGPVLPLLFLGAFAVNRRAALFAVFFWAPALLAYAYFFPGGLNHYFFRYQHPVLPLIAAFAGGGAAYLVYLARRNDWAVKALVVAGLLIVAGATYGFYERWRNTYEEGAVSTLRELEPMAMELNTIIEPHETLATHDIGAVGYFADYNVLDLVGLVNEEVVSYHDGRRLAEYIEQEEPEYLLIFPNWDLFFLKLNAAGNPERYELIRTYESSVVTREAYLLYRVHYN